MKINKKILAMILISTLAIISTGCTAKKEEIDPQVSILKKEQEEKDKELENKEAEIKELQMQLEQKPEVVEKIIQSESDIKKEIAFLQEIQNEIGDAYVGVSEFRKYGEADSNIEYTYNHHNNTEIKEEYVNIINNIEDARYNYIVPIINYVKEGKYNNTDELFMQKEAMAQEVEKNCFYVQTMYYLDAIERGHGIYMDEEVEARNIQKRNIFDKEEYNRCEKEFLKKDKELASVFSIYN